MFQIECKLEHKLFLYIVYRRQSYLSNLLIIFYRTILDIVLNYYILIIFIHNSYTIIFFSVRNKCFIYSSFHPKKMFVFGLFRIRRYIAEVDHFLEIRGRTFSIVSHKHGSINQEISMYSIFLEVEHFPESKFYIF